jgi:hypothetical protein
MKSSLLLVVMVFAINVAQSRIWRINNNSGINADFTTLQAAHDAATNGDTLHLEPSAFSYGGLIASKKLAIFGPGHSLTQNNNLEYINLTSQVEEINFEIGSENSVLSGVQSSSQNIFIKTSNISILGNKLNGIYFAHPSSITSGTYSISGTIIRGNWVSFIFSESSNGNVAHNFSGTSISANIIYVGVSMDTPASYNHNFIGSLTCRNSVVVNNIIKNANHNCASDNCNLFIITKNNTINNNVFSDEANPTNTGFLQNGQNNIFNPGLANVIVGTFNNAETDFQLLPNSVAIGAGTGGTDVGPFAGGYVLSGIPQIPTIYNLLVSPTGSAANGLQVTVKSKTN